MSHGKLYNSEDFPHHVPSHSRFCVLHTLCNLDDDGLTGYFFECWNILFNSNKEELYMLSVTMDSFMQVLEIIGVTVVKYTKFDIKIYTNQLVQNDSSRRMSLNSGEIIQV